ncbi:uncharacterized protein RAG0_13217 [Rhynchosporium agropyri]|uniref:Uncharacterized protein n=1 Tax=Rhynchosporium agropyri TaxID=914238 RepID=A0A1E1LBQ9_9HELO|nr:uncharacterized protein RAG0_13217 [Rhynchosporium agropyri]
MCRVHQSTHSYSGWFLELQNPEPAEGQPSATLPKSLLYRITASILREVNANTSGSPAPEQSDELSTSPNCSAHVMRYFKSIVIEPDGLDFEKRPDAVSGISTHLGECPVCKAAAKAVKEALERENMVEFP